MATLKSTSVNGSLSVSGTLSAGAYKISSNVDFNNSYGINNIQFLEGTTNNTYGYNCIIFNSSIDPSAYGFCSKNQAINAKDSAEGFLVAGSGKLLNSGSFVWTSTSLVGTAHATDKYGGTASSYGTMVSDFLKTHSYMGTHVSTDSDIWYNLINIVHRGYQLNKNGSADTGTGIDNNKYGMQIMSKLVSSNDPIQYRHYSSGTYGNWITIWDKNNLKYSYSSGVLSITTS